MKAADLAASVGVNVHLEYTDSAYADTGRTLAALKVLRLSLVRDAAPAPHNQGQASYGALANAGVRFDLFVNGGDLSTPVSGLTALQTQYPGRRPRDRRAQDSEKHYGLFDIDDRPKVSAQMLRRLIQLLQDDAADAHTFPLRSEAFAI